MTEPLRGMAVQVAGRGGGIADAVALVASHEGAQVGAACRDQTPELQPITIQGGMNTW